MSEKLEDNILEFAPMPVAPLGAKADDLVKALLKAFETGFEQGLNSTIIDGVVVSVKDAPKLLEENIAMPDEEEPRKFIAEASARRKATVAHLKVGDTVRTLNPCKAWTAGDQIKMPVGSVGTISKIMGHYGNLDVFFSEDFATATLFPSDVEKV